MNSQAPTIARPASLQESEEPHQAEEESPSTAPAGHGFAEEQGPTVVLLMGVVLFVLACVSFFAGHLTIAVVLAVAGVVTVVLATGLARLQIFKLEVLRLFGFLAKFRDHA